MQFDADTVGAAGPEADAEMCMMMADTMDALGLAGKYVVKVSSRKLLDGILDAVGLGTDPHRSLVVLRAIDKLDRLGEDGVRELLTIGRTDLSGDFTKGAGLSSDEAAFVLAMLHATVAIEGKAGGGEAHGTGAAAFTPHPDHPIGDYFGRITKVSFIEGVIELSRMRQLFLAAGYESDRIRVDPTVVRGLEYYTGPVFEIELTFQVPNEKGQPVVFGSVGGGGRYDGLVSRFRSEPVPATGFSIGVSRLASALKLTGLLGAEQAAGPVVVLVLDRDPAALADYQKMTSDLRQAGIRAEMYLGSSGMNAQMKYADRRNAAAAVIVGSNERAEGKVTIKDLAAGAEQAKSIKDNAEYKAAKVGQWTAARGDLVAELLKIPAVQRMKAGP